MPSLQTQAQLLNRAQRILLCVIVAAIFTFYFIGYRPATVAIQRLQTSTLAHQQELRSNQAKAVHRNEIAAKNEKLKQQLEQIKKPSKQQEFPDLIKELTLFASQNSLKKFNYKPLTPVPSELFWEMPISLTFEGDGMSVFNFLKTTEEMPRLTRIRSVMLKTKDDRTGTVQAQVMANIYFSTE
jgi:Tfp pilus assembly protein PilO